MLLAACVLWAGCISPGQAARVRSADALRDSIATLVAAAGGKTGVVAVHVESGERIAVNPDLPVFMSSVVKLPIVLQLLDRVDRGELRLDDAVPLAARDLRIGNAGLAAEFPNGGIQLTVRSLIERAIVTSDNSASDALLRYSGGARRVMQELSRLEIRDLRIDSTYADVAWSYYGISPPPDSMTWTPALFERLTGAATPEQRDRGARAFMIAPTNRATAEGIADLLLRLVRGTVLSDSSRRHLYGLLRNSKNPASRMVAGAPAGVAVAHKTGTMGSWRGATVAVNDAGILTLPSGDHVVLVVMIGGGTAEYARQELVIANVTRAVATHWMRP